MKIDMQEKIGKAIAELEEEGKFNEIIKENIKKTFESVTKDVFSSWSEVSKLLKKEMTERIGINFKELKMENYNDYVIKVINNEIADALNENTKRLVIEATRKALTGYTKKEIEFREIIERYKESISRYNDFEERKEINLEISGGHSLKHIYIRPEKERGFTKETYRLCIDENGYICSITSPKGGEINSWTSFDKFLQSLFFNHVKVLNISENNCDLEYGLEEDY